MTPDLKIEINNLENNLRLISGDVQLMPEVKVNNIVTWDLAATFTNEEIQEMLINAIDKKMKLLGKDILDFELTQDMHDSFINDVLITQEAMEEVEWEIRDREYFVEELKYTFIPEAKAGGRENDLSLMESDLKYLEGFEDKYILSSQCTNSYLIQSNPQDQPIFKKKCEALMALSKNN